MTNTPKPQANKTIDEILNYCRVNYAPEAIHDEYEEQVKSRVKALIDKAQIEAEDTAMAKFGIKRGVKYDIQASDTVIVLTLNKSEENK